MIYRPTLHLEVLYNGQTGPLQQIISRYNSYPNLLVHINKECVQPLTAQIAIWRYPLLLKVSLPHCYSKSDIIIINCVAPAARPSERPSSRRSYTCA